MFKLTAKALACAAIMSCAGLAQAADAPILIKFAHVVADNTPTVSYTHLTLPTNREV